MSFPASSLGGLGFCQVLGCTGEGTEAKGKARGALSQKTLKSNWLRESAGGQKSLSLMTSMSGIAMPRRMDVAPVEGSSTGRCCNKGTTKELDGDQQLHHLRASEDLF